MSRSVRTDYEALRVFEKHPEADAYRVGGSFTPYAIVATDKRFTDGELAAEFYKASCDHYAANSMHLMFEDSDTESALNDSRDWMFCMERFARLPHFDE